MGPISLKRYTALGGVTPTAATTALLLSTVLAGSLAETTHIRLSAIGGTLYIRYGATASATDYHETIADGDCREFALSNWSAMSIFSTANNYALSAFKV